MSAEDKIIRWLATKDQKQAVIRHYINRINDLRNLVDKEVGLSDLDRKSFLDKLTSAENMVKELEKQLDGFLKAVWNWNSIRKIQLPGLEMELTQLEKNFAETSKALRMLNNVPIISKEAIRAIENEVHSLPPTQTKVQQSHPLKPEASQQQVPASLPPPPVSYRQNKAAYTTQQLLPLSGRSQASPVGSGMIGSHSESPNSEAQYQTQHVAIESVSNPPKTGYVANERRIHAHNTSVSSTNTFGYAKHSHYHRDEQASTCGVEYMAPSQQRGHNVHNSSISSSSYSLEEDRTTAQGQQHDNPEGYYRPGHSVNISVSSSNTFGYPSNADDDQTQTHQMWHINEDLTHE